MLYTKEQVKIKIIRLKQEIKNYKEYINNEKRKIRARVKSQSFQLFRKFGRKYKCTHCGNTFDANLFCSNCGYKGNRREKPGHCPNCGARIRYNYCTVCGATKDLEAKKRGKEKIKLLDRQLKQFIKEKEKEITMRKNYMKKLK